MVTKRFTLTAVGYLSALVLFSACTSVESQVQSATQQPKTAPGDRTVSYDPTDRLTPDNIGAQTERPIPSGRLAPGNTEAMPRDRIVPCADEQGNTSASLDCDQMNREGRRAGVRTEANDPSLAEACPSRLDATGNVVYDDPTCPDRYIRLVGSCRSRVDAKGNVIYEDPNCPVRARRQMGSSFENIRWTQESAFYDRYTDKAVKHAREAEMAGEQGHVPEMLRHAELSLDQAKEAQRVGSQPDLNEGIMALRNSISLGQSHLGPSATLAVRDARIKLSRAAGMSVRDTRTPEERAMLAKAIAGLLTRTVRGQLARDFHDTRTEGGEHYVLKDQTREIPIALSPEMSRHVEVGDVVEAQINSKGQVVAISPAQ